MADADDDTIRALIKDIQDLIEERLARVNERSFKIAVTAAVHVVADVVLQAKNANADKAAGHLNVDSPIRRWCTPTLFPAILGLHQILSA
jgi:hypothetical protein